MTARARRATGLIRLSTDSAKPLSHQLADTLRRLIVEGIWIKDDKLPGSRTIAADAHVSRNTVNAALEILMSEGMLEARGRSGLFVVWKHAPRQPRQDVEITPEASARRPFSLDALPLELFPLDAWKRLKSKFWSRASSDALEPSSCAGARPLREVIAVLVNITAGISCTAEQVFVVGGLRDALTLARGSRAGIEAWIEDPAHPQTRFAMHASGISAIPIPVDVQGVNVEMAQQLAGDAKLAVVRPAFQFPTGAMLSPARARALIDWSQAQNSLILEDATESEFSFSKRTVRSLVAFQSGTVVHFNTFSRTMFPAMRLAYVIAPEGLVDAFQRTARQLDTTISVSTQMVMADFIHAGHFAKHVRKCRDLYAERHTALLEALAAEAPALDADRQYGGMHVCARLPPGNSDTVLSDRAVALGVDAAPLSTMFARRAASHGLVLGFAAFDRPQIARAVNSLARVLPAPAKSFGATA